MAKYAVGDILKATSSEGHLYDHNLIVKVTRRHYNFLVLETGETDYEFISYVDEPSDKRSVWFTKVA